MHLMDWTATIMDFGGIDPARANPDFDGMSFKDTFYNGNDISPSPRKDLFMFMNGSPAVSSNQFHEIRIILRGRTVLFQNRRFYFQTGVYRRGDMKVAYATAAKMFFRGESHLLPAEGACGYDRIDLQEQF